jgi:hypothetical protein
VTSAAHCEQQITGAREMNCGKNVRDIGAARNRQWLAVDHSIIQLARSIVAPIVRFNQLAAQTLAKMIENYGQSYFYFFFWSS